MWPRRSSSSTSSEAPILVDANILIYARDSESPFHEPARRWLEGALNGEVRIGLPWESTSAFVRVATHPRALAQPLSGAAAFDQVRAWLAAPTAWIPTPTDRHAEILGELISKYDLRGNRVPDGHLAALALSHGVGLVSADTDFARFSALNWLNPLA